MVDHINERESSPAVSESSITDYEAQRQENIAKNEKLKRALFRQSQPEPAATDNSNKKRKRAGSKKSKAPVKRRNKGANTSNEDAAAQPPARCSTRANPAANADAPAPIQSEEERALTDFLERGPRSQLNKTYILVGGSERPAGTKKNLLCSHRLGEEFLDSRGLLEKIDNGTEEENVATKELKEEAKALAMAKCFGHMEGTNVGRVFRSREELGQYLVHRMPVGGIFGGEGIGAYSIVASGKYEDEEEEHEEKGETFFFSGEGGRASETKGKKKKGNLQRGAQACAQKLTKGNAALLTSCATASPVRVIRGIRLDMRDRYRYDGVQVWEKSGKSGHGIYSFKLRRLPGQAPIVWTGEEQKGQDVDKVKAKAKANSGDGDEEELEECVERRKEESEGEEGPKAEKRSEEVAGVGDVDEAEVD